LSRRKFLHATGLAGGGLMLTIALPNFGAGARGHKRSFVYPPAAFIRIDKDSS